MESLAHLFTRDLDKLKEEISSYQNENNLWITADGIANSGGNLTMHLTGNLLHFIGANIANSGYKRDREHEFAGKDVPPSDLVQEIEATKAIIQETLPKLSPEQLSGPYPGKIPYEMNMEQFLLHLYGHFTYHLGQINYHRRLLDQ